MTTPSAPPTINTKPNKDRGSLSGTLVRTLLVFTIIPLILMAGAAYLRARVLLREQAITQSENLLINQLRVVESGIESREQFLEQKFSDASINTQIEVALKLASPNAELDQIRSKLITQFQSPEGFDHFMLVDTTGAVKIASNEAWHGQTIPAALLDHNGAQTYALYGIPVLYENEFILITSVKYQTARGSILGAVLGITEKRSLLQMVQPLNGLAPFAQTYFVLNDGNVIANNPETGNFTLLTDADEFQSATYASLSEMMGADTKPAALDVTAPDGEQALAQLQWFPQMQSGVVLAIKANDIYREVNSLAPFTILLALLTLIATTAALTWGTRRAFRPLETLTEITRKFAEGDWSQRAKIASNDEIGALAHSFNEMADQLGEIYQSLENKVDERARQIRTAAEVAQNITAITNLDEMLNKTVELLVKEFGFYQASIFMVDRSGKFVDFKTGYGSATQGLLEKKYRLEVGSASIMGWVAANNRTRAASDVLEDPLHLKNELLPETRSEASVPISLGEQVLGVLDVQSAQPQTFGADTLIMLETLASLIAAAIQTAGLLEMGQVNFQELDRLYRSSRRIAQAGDEASIINACGQILQGAPYPAAFFKVENSLLKTVLVSDTARELGNLKWQQSQVQVNLDALESFLLRGGTATSTRDANLPAAVKQVMGWFEIETATFLPIRKQDELTAMIMVGSREQTLTGTSIQPYENLAGLMSVALERADALEQTERHLKELEAFASINELIASSSDMDEFYNSLHLKIQQTIGNYNLIVALYDEKENKISIPFSYEDGQYQSIDPFPLGEGLTSILLRTRQPLLLAEDVERRSAELGAKVVGKPARSWMGAPMLVQGKPIGALIIQDVENENAFNEQDLKFFSTLAGQVSGVLYNVRLLDESNRKALQLETAAEIARDISTARDLDELLIKAVDLIYKRFNFYHAGVFLMDLAGEFAVIREATGEAGAQMKRTGHKIGVGSKSIVGYVTGRGEALIVDDTAKDATYYPNPLLPDTRAEAAIPLRVGDKILGALDVQSTKPYSFSEENMRSLQILADQLAVAVANTELFAETQEHLSQHRLLHHITSTAASGTTLEEALEGAVKGLQVTLGGDRVIIFLADREKKFLEVRASIGYAEDIARTRVEMGQGIIGWVASHRRPLRVRDVSQDPRYYLLSPNTASELAVPLIYRNELLGVINVESEQLDAYTENDEEMLGTLGGSLAAIIANARLLEQLRAQSERERLIYDATSRIRRSTDIQSILTTTANEIAKITGARYTRIQMNDDITPTSKAAE